MMKASQLRQKARNSLTGKWGTAIGVAVTTALLTGGGSSMIDTITQGMADAEMPAVSAVSFLAMLSAISVVLSLIGLIFGGAVQMGAARFHLNVVDGKQAAYMDVFSQMSRIGTGFSMTLLQSAFLLLWMLPAFAVMTVIIFAVGMQIALTTGAVPTLEAILEGCWLWLPLVLPAIIPVLIAQLRYALMPYLLSEYTGLSAMNAMRESKRLMKGNKWRLFCLELSFLGWYLLSFATLGIGFFWLAPYMNTAYAAFYREIMDIWKAQVEMTVPHRLPEAEL